MNIEEVRADQDEEQRTEWVKEDIYEFKVCTHTFSSLESHYLGVTI